MADQSTKNSTSPQKSGSGQANQDMTAATRSSQQYAGSSGGSTTPPSAPSAQTIADVALSASRDLKNTAADIASASADALKNQAAGLIDAAKTAASQAGGRLQQEVDTQKNAGAQYVGNLASTLRRVAKEFDNDLPVAGTYIRKAASQVEDVSDTIQNGNINDLLRGAQSFARRQPTAFLGLAVLAGFGAIRFLKSSGGTQSVAVMEDRDASGSLGSHQPG